MFNVRSSNPNSQATVFLIGRDLCALYYRSITTALVYCVYTLYIYNSLYYTHSEQCSKLFYVMFNEQCSFYIKKNFF